MFAMIDETHSRHVARVQLVCERAAQESPPERLTQRHNQIDLMKSTL